MLHWTVMLKHLLLYSCCAFSAGFALHSSFLCTCIRDGRALGFSFDFTVLIVFYYFYSLLLVFYYLLHISYFPIAYSLMTFACY